MPSPKSSQPKQLDPSAAEAAFNKLLPRLQAIAPEKLAVPRTSVDMAAIHAAGVAEALNAPEMRARFKLLPKELFELANLDDLGPAALAAWHAATQLLVANAQGTEAKLPVALVEESSELKARMLRVTGYAFDEGTPQGDEVADIRKGTGYRDLAQDLTRLATLYGANKAILHDDKLRYRADDAARANALAHQILQTLGQNRTTDQEIWADRVQRAWALLSELYTDVTATANWIGRNDADPRSYPSLVTAGKAAPKRAKSTEGDEKAPVEGHG